MFAHIFGICVFRCYTFEIVGGFVRGLWGALCPIWGDMLEDFWYSFGGFPGDVPAICLARTSVR